MTFMRTSGGINAQKKFHKVDMTFHIEGKNVNDKPGIKTSDLCDYKYYKAILDHYLPEHRIKIKVLGCCRSVLDYHSIIKQKKLKNDIVIIDRDYNGIISSRINDYGVIYTYGYSWENDFWTEVLSTHVIAMLTAGNNDSVDRYLKSIKRAAKRISLLSKINICSKSHGLTLFNIAKKGGSKGVALNFNNNFVLPSREFSRLTSAVKKSHQKESIISIYNKIKTIDNRLIQGHFFEYLACGLIVNCVKLHSNVSKDIDFEALKNIALYVFSSNPKLWLDEDTYKHYENSLSILN